MKKTKMFLLIAASLVLTDAPVQAIALSHAKATETTSFGRKRKGYKVKRGGLFNTGLFRKKNPCGCPNH